MSNTSEEAVREKPRRGGTVAFTILFIFLFLLLLLATVPFLNPTGAWFQATYKRWFDPAAGFGRFFQEKLNEGLYSSVFLFPNQFSYRGVTHSEILQSCIEAWLFLWTCLSLLYLLLVPFVNMAHNKRTGKAHPKARKGFLIFGFILTVLVSAYFVLLVLSATFPALSVIQKSYAFMMKWAEHMENAPFWFYVLFFGVFFVFGFLLNWFCILGKKQVTEPEESVSFEEPEEKEDEDSDDAMILVGAVQRAPLASARTLANLASEKKKSEEEKPAEKVVMKKEEEVQPTVLVPKEEKKPEAVPEEKKASVPEKPKEEAKPFVRPELVPTNRDIAILNLLEPFTLKPSALPDLYQTDVDQVLRDLEPKSLEPSVLPEDELTENGKAAFQEKLSPVKVLPGIDEWSASPWPAKEEEVESTAEDHLPLPKEEAKPVEKVDVTEEAKPVVESPLPFEVSTPAPEAEKEEVENNPYPGYNFHNDALTLGSRPQEEEHPYEKTLTGAPYEASVLLPNETLNLPEEKSAPIDTTWNAGTYIPEKKEEEPEEPKQEAQPQVEEKKPVEEAPAPVKPEEKKVYDGYLFTNENLDDGKRPQEESHPAEEKIVGEPYEATIVVNNKAKPVEDPKKEEKIDTTWNAGTYVPVQPQEAKPQEVEEKPVEEAPAPKEVAPSYPGYAFRNEPIELGQRPQEESHPAQEPVLGEPGTSETVVRNERLNLPEWKQAPIDTAWNAGTYVPEKKPQPENGIKPLKPVQPINSRPHGPISLVQPMKHEEKKPEEKPEEKKLAPVSGPLHSIRQAKKDIVPVKPQHVKFELSRYKIKTYEGDLTASQAFAMGVTKVQPMAQPAFGFDSDEPAWKQKRREEEIRKNGYANISQKTTGFTNPENRPSRPVADYSSATSIRDLVKANKLAKAEEAKEEKKAEEPSKKPTAPIRPIKPIKPVQPVKPAEPKKEGSGNAPVRPIPTVKPMAAPSGAKTNLPKPRGPIQPIRPVKPIEPKDYGKKPTKPVDPIKK